MPKVLYWSEIWWLGRSTLYTGTLPVHQQFLIFSNHSAMSHLKWLKSPLFPILMLGVNFSRLSSIGLLPCNWLEFICLDHIVASGSIQTPLLRLYINGVKVTRYSPIWLLVSMNRCLITFKKILPNRPRLFHCKDV